MTLNYSKRRKEDYEQREPYALFMYAMSLVAGALFVMGLCLASTKLFDQRTNMGLILPVAVSFFAFATGAIMNAFITVRGWRMYRKTKVLHPWLVVSFMFWSVPVIAALWYLGYLWTRS